MTQTTPALAKQQFLINWLDWLKCQRARAQREAYRGRLETNCPAQFERVELPFLRAPILLRTNSNDREVFRSIFEFGTCNVATWTGRPMKRIIDCGAHIGLTTIFFANLYPDADILAIEPIEENYALLVENVRQYSNVRTMQAALWPTETELSVLPRICEYDAHRVREIRKGPIKGVTLYTLFESFGNHLIDLLKVDIEGSEKAVFGHSDRDWVENVATISIELHDAFVPGCSAAVFGALREKTFRRRRLGDNEFIMLS